MSAHSKSSASSIVEAHVPDTKDIAGAVSNTAQPKRNFGTTESISMQRDYVDCLAKVHETSHCPFDASLT